MRPDISKIYAIWVKHKASNIVGQVVLVNKKLQNPIRLQPDDRSADCSPVNAAGFNGQCRIKGAYYDERDTLTLL
jgi:hypothetical protein